MICIQHYMYVLTSKLALDAARRPGEPNCGCTLTSSSLLPSSPCAPPPYFYTVWCQFAFWTLALPSICEFFQCSNFRSFNPTCAFRVLTLSPLQHVPNDVLCPNTLMSACLLYYRKSSSCIPTPSSLKLTDFASRIPVWGMLSKRSREIRQMLELTCWILRIQVSVCC